MKIVLQLALTLLISALLFAACAPVFAQDAKDKPAATLKKDDSIPLPADKAKALEDVKTAFEKANRDAELAQAKLDAAKAQMEKAQLQFVLIVESAKKETKCDECQLTEDGKSLKKSEKTAQAKP